MAASTILRTLRVLPPELAGGIAHECGHATVAWRLGHPLEALVGQTVDQIVKEGLDTWWIEMADPPDWLRGRDQIPPEHQVEAKDYVCIALAGVTACRRYYVYIERHPPSMASLLKGGGRLDEQLADSIIRRIEPSATGQGRLRRELQKWTEVILAEPRTWRALLDLAGTVAMLMAADVLPGLEGRPLTALLEAQPKPKPIRRPYQQPGRTP